MPVGCIIFDMDGTLVDSEGLSARAFLELLPGLGRSEAELAERYRGRKLALIMAALEQETGAPLPEDFEPRFRAAVARLFDRELRPVAGAGEMLAALNRPFCVASNGPLFKMRHALGVTGLARYFEDRMFSAYDVGAWKPEPGLFLHAAAAMGAEPAGCLVVEDSWLGVEAGLAAGMQVCKLHDDGPGIEPGVPRIRALAELPDLVARLTRG
jgi:HAD superfamily hydrolase (TIGR01509 family)